MSATKVDVPDVAPRGGVYWWKDHWVFCSEVYYFGSTGDESGYRVISKEPLSDEALGQHVRSMLLASRMLTPEEIRVQWSPEVREPRYERWVDWCIRGVGAPNRKALFKGFKNCGVRQHLGVIEIRPVRRERGEGWVGLGDPDAIVRIAETASDVDLGAALRLAMSRAVG